MNYCLCCGGRAESYGAAGIGNAGFFMQCSREVCVICLEGAHAACGYGTKLAQPAMEYHQNCIHDSKKDGLDAMPKGITKARLAEIKASQDAAWGWHQAALDSLLREGELT